MKLQHHEVLIDEYGIDDGASPFANPETEQVDSDLEIDQVVADLIANYQDSLRSQSANGEMVEIPAQLRQIIEVCQEYQEARFQYKRDSYLPFLILLSIILPLLAIISRAPLSTTEVACVPFVALIAYSLARGIATSAKYTGPTDNDLDSLASLPADALAQSITRVKTRYQQARDEVLVLAEQLGLSPYTSDPDRFVDRILSGTRSLQRDLRQQKQDTDHRRRKQQTKEAAQTLFLEKAKALDEARARLGIDES